MQMADLNTLAEGGCNHRALPANEKPPAVRVDDYFYANENPNKSSAKFLMPFLFLDNKKIFEYNTNNG